MRVTNKYVQQYLDEHPEVEKAFASCPDKYVAVLSRNGRTGAIELLALAMPDDEVPQSGVMPLVHWPQD